MEVPELSDTFPQVRTPLYRRINTRQAQLVEMAARWNADYFTICATGPLSGGEANLQNLLQGDASLTVPEASQIKRVQVMDPGTSAYAAGRKVHVMPLSQMNAELPPRVVITNGVIKQVDTDLAGVVSVQVFYTRRPAAITATTSVVGIPEPHDHLLELDLAKALCARATAIDGKDRSGIVAYLTSQEEQDLALFEGHVRSQTVLTARFYDTAS